MLPIFREPASYWKPQKYRFLPFRFLALDDRMVLVNLVGEHELIERHEFDQFVNKKLSPESDVYFNLKAKHFLADTDSDTPVQLLATKLRTKYSHLAGFTKLHIFVVTLRCDHSCHYCQVSRVTAVRSKYDMTRESADRALDFVFRAPSRHQKIEFQGGEPLLNFEMIRYVVEEATRRNAELDEDGQKSFRFVIATNLSLTKSWHSPSSIKSTFRHRLMAQRSYTIAIVLEQKMTPMRELCEALRASVMHWDTTPSLP